MPNLEERTSALERRAGDVEMFADHSAQVAKLASEESLQARESHQKNIGLLTVLRHTQVEMSKTLDEHTTILNEHSKKLDEHSKKLDEHSKKLDEHSKILKEHSEILNEHSEILNEHSEILNEHSEILNEHSEILNEHSKKLDEHTLRFDAIDGKLGVLTVGMYSIESMLRGMTEADES